MVESGVGIKLFYARMEKGLSRKYVADKANMHETTLKRYEDGHVKGMAYDKLQMLANILGLDMKYLTGWNSKVENETKTNNIVDGLTDEELKKVEEYIRFLKAQRS